MTPGGELAGIHYLAPENPIPFPPDFGIVQTTIPNFNLNRLLLSSNFPNSLLVPPQPCSHHHEFTSQSSSLSNNSSTSDEVEEQQQQQQLRIIDERKQRRMISNRESARRSRMRKQKHLDELWLQVVRLRTENHSLIDKLNHTSESHDRVLQENARLKEEASDLRQMLTQLQMNAALRELEDQVPCNTAHLRAGSTANQSISNSVDLLH